jgi:ribonuclease PH
MIRGDGRRPHELRPLSLRTGVLDFAEGSCLVEMGRTRVLCAATVEARTPQFAREAGTGWITAEYGMLPRSTQQRTPRERGATSGRTYEIQRLIGRSLRAVAQLDLLGERTLVVDCDVLQADGGTRTAAINGGFVALALALRRLLATGELPLLPLSDQVAAVSVGIVDGAPMLDLCYQEDVRAQVDMNVVMTGSGQLVEVQGTAEGHPFDRRALDELLDLAWEGIQQILAAQRQALQAAGLVLPA